MVVAEDWFADAVKVYECRVSSMTISSLADLLKTAPPFSHLLSLRLPEITNMKRT